MTTGITFDKKYFDENMPSDSVYQNIEWAYTFNPPYPDKPKKPVLSVKHSAVEAKEYSAQLSEYEKEMEAYRTAMDNYREEAGKIKEIVENYIKEESGLNDIPEQYRAKVYSLAYEQGHSSGYSEVYIHLCNLVDVF